MILKREHLIIKGTKLERTEERDGLASPVRLVIINRRCNKKVGRWYIIVEKRNQHTFTSKLAYDLYNEFRTNGDSDLLPSSVKLDNLVYNGYN